ncbi:probable cytochrome P450 12b2, mitochondrial [Drosophila willistoni]|uniref:probable cytochrome P450 12b2, mitochondrial n=1 Tax=Drosophila willistoni TaxID=7260 RepID=UPI001F07592B|nr:probable cytochrome P450 12b2, mitochondrial [Drosophila willistoni]
MWKCGKPLDMCKTLSISGILPAFFNSGEKLENTNITEKNPTTDSAKVHDSSSPYSDQQRSNIFHGITGFFSKTGEAWETIKNKDYSVITNRSNDAWETIKNKANPVIKNAPNYMPNFNQLKYISKEFMNKLESLRDSKTHELMPDFLSNKSVNGDFKKSTEFQRFFDNYKKNMKMSNTYLEAAIQSFELVDSDKNKWVLEQLRTFKKQVAGIIAIGMLIADTFTNAIRPQADAPVEIDQIGENETMLNQLWRLSKGAPALIAIFLLMLGADTTSFCFVSVIYYLLWYLSK